MSSQKIDEVILKSADVQARVLRLAPDGATKWHYHSEVTDTMICLQGRITVALWNPQESRELSPGEYCSIPPSRIHSVKNAHSGESTYLLIQGVGQYDFIAVEDVIV